MKHKFIIFGACAVIALAAASALFISAPHADTTSVSMAEIGKPAPAFSAPDSKGGTQELANYLGKTVVLEWTNHECPYVKKHYNSGNMQTLQTNAVNDGVVWLRVISSAPGAQGHLSAQEIESLAATQGVTATATIIDETGVIGQSYGAKTTPHMYIIDDEGVLVYAGGIDDNPSSDIETVKTAKNYVAAALDDIKSDREIAVNQSRPYGCSVKYK